MQDIRPKNNQELSPQFIERVSSPQNSIRIRAIKHLSRSEMHQEKLQNIPLDLVSQGEHLAALRYIQTLWTLDYPFSIEIFFGVVQSVLAERVQCLDSGEWDYLQKLDSSLTLLFRRAKNQKEYISPPKFFLLMGQFEEQKGRPNNALSHYNTVIEFADIEGYFAGAKIYIQLGKIDTALSLLRTGFGIHGDIRFLKELILLQCRYKKLGEAVKSYQELQFLDPNTPPFIFLKRTIENDTELLELEKGIASYVSQGSFSPSIELAELSQSATGYIAEQVHIENDRLLEQEKIVKDWTIEEHSRYRESIFRRLHLMQIDIFSLCNPQYIQYYLQDIERIGFSGTPFMKRKLAEFFSTQSSQDVIQTVYSKESDFHKEDLYVNLSIHLQRLHEIFFQPEFFHINKNTLVPLLRECMLQGGFLEDREDAYLDESIHSFQNEFEFFYSLRPQIRSRYEYFLEEIDQKYGVFYRRQFQAMLTSQDTLSREHGEVLHTNPDIALLFWIHKTFIGQIPIDSEVGAPFIQEYSLFSLSPQNALLFGMILCEICHQPGITYLANYPNMLDNVEALYSITEGLRFLEASERRKTLEQLHSISREKYCARGFFDHINFTIRDAQRNGGTCSPEQIHLLLGNIRILQNKSRTQAILDFETAGIQYHSSEGMLQAGDLHLSLQEYSKALACYERVILLEDTQKSLDRILICCFQFSDFDGALKYIQYGLRKGYDMSNALLEYNTSSRLS